MRAVRPGAPAARKAEGPKSRNLPSVKSCVIVESFRDGIGTGWKACPHVVPTGKRRKVWGLGKSRSANLLYEIRQRKVSRCPILQKRPCFFAGRQTQG